MKLNKHNSAIVSILLLIMTLQFIGCEEEIPTSIEGGYEPETYLSPQHSLVWSPDGSMLVFVFDYFLAVLDMDAGDLRQLTGTGSYEEPTWSPDGVKIAYSTASYGVRADIWSKNADGTTVAKRVTSHNASDYYPRWSPDGRWIAFHSYRTRSLDIWIKNADGSGEAMQVTTDTETDRNAEWSPDGSRLAFESKRMGDFDIWAVLMDGSSDPYPVTSDEATDTNFRWSPDGGRIAFMSSRSGYNGIWVKNSDGKGDAVYISNEHPGSEMPDWSPDGKWIVYVSDEVIYAKRSDASGSSMKIVDGLEPCWSPDGTNLAYVAWIENQYKVEIMELPEELRASP